jgi:hypothetical protein
MARYTPEFLQALRHDYEDTDEPARSIAERYKIGLSTIYSIGQREGWRRRTERVREVPPAERLLDEAESLATQAAASDTIAGAAAAGLTSAHAGDGAAAAAPAETIDDALARIEALIGKEIAAEEIALARLAGRPRSRADAERAARTLASLTRTLQTVRDMRTPPPGERDDDMPEDIDEFRRELARRIDAFVAGWTAEDENSQAAPAPLSD